MTRSLSVEVNCRFLYDDHHIIEQAQRGLGASGIRLLG
jgi:hypothetical protein